MKPRLRVTDIPERVKYAQACLLARSVSWAELPRNGDASVLIGNADEKLVINSHSVLLMRSFPRLGLGYEPVHESRAR